MRKSRRGMIQDNPIYNKFVVVRDDTSLFSVGATFPATQILGFGMHDKPVGEDELPEGLVMLYKKRGKTIYRCQFTNGKLVVIAKK